MASLDNSTRKRLRKDLDRLKKKQAKAARRLEILETRRQNGKVPAKKFHDKRSALKTQIRVFGKTMRKLEGKLGKSGVTLD